MRKLIDVVSLLFERVEKIDGHVFFVNPSVQQIKSALSRVADMYGRDNPPELRGVSDGHDVYVFYGDMHHNVALRMLGISRRDLCFYISIRDNEYFTNDSSFVLAPFRETSELYLAAQPRALPGILQIGWVSRMVNAPQS